MIMYGTSERSFLKLIAIASVLVTALGACQKEQATTTLPAAEQSTQMPSSDKNTGNTTGNMQQPGQGGSAQENR